MTLFLILISFLSLAENDASLSTVNWRTQRDGSIYLVPQNQNAILNTHFMSGSRYPASASLGVTSLPYSHTFQGLGKFSCLKKGFQSAGIVDSSNKFIAAIAIKAKERNDISTVSQQTKDQLSLKEAIQTLSAIGVCKNSDYPFRTSDIYWSESWINSPHAAADNSQFKKVFGIDTSRLEQVIEKNSSFDKIKRNWDFWAKNTPAYNCAQHNPTKIVHVCRSLARACDVPSDVCEESSHQNLVRHSPNNKSHLRVASKSHALEPNDLENLGKSNLHPIEDVRLDFSNKDAGHGPDPRGSHGQGPI